MVINTPSDKEMLNVPAGYQKVKAHKESFIDENSHN